MARKAKRPLTETHPELCKEWDYEKNDMHPEDTSLGSTKKVWWKCAQGHSFLRSPNQRTHSRIWERGRDYTECPHCSHAVATPGEYSLLTEYPELMEEWDWETNAAEGIDPDELLPKSGKKVHWVCKDNPEHRWEATPNNRISGGRCRQGSGCPYCDGKAFKEGITDLETLYPDIAVEWDYERNDDTPNHVHAGSLQNAHWICPKGHRYEMPPNRRTKQGQGCSVCAGKKVIYETSLACLYPDVAAEWDYEKNECAPDEVAPKSSKKAWWICPKNPKHSYQSAISSRTANHTGCPYCSGQQVLPEESFGTLYPDLLQEWDYEKNEGIDPFAFSPKSGKKVWWKCSYGHSWRTSISVRANGHGCPECKKGNMTSFAEQLVFLACQEIFAGYDVMNRYMSSFGEEIDIYIPHLSLGIEPGDWVLHKKKYEKDKAKRAACKENSIRIITIYDEYKEKAKPFEEDCYVEDKFFGNARNYLLVRDILHDIFADAEALHGFWSDKHWEDLSYKARRASSRTMSNPSRSLTASYPEIASQWHPTLNGELTPEDIYPSSHQMVHWLCPNGHEYQASAHDRVHDGKGCGVCSKRTSDPRYNTISKLYPDFVELFDESNGITPEEITPFNASKKIIWRCPHCEETFSRTPWSFFHGLSTKCPHCGGYILHAPNSEMTF